MKDKLTSIRSKIQKSEAKLRELEAELKTLRQRERQLEDEEILATVRGKVGEDGDYREALRLINQSNEMAAAKKPMKRCLLPCLPT